VRRRLALRLLPLTIFVAVLMLGVRLGDLWLATVRGSAWPNPAPVQAQTPPKNQPAGGNPPAKPGEDKNQPPGAPGAPAAGAPAPVPPAGTAPTTPSATTLDPGAEPSADKPGALDMAVLKRLNDRRADLDRRGRELDQREALLVATEQRVSQKLTELEAVRNEIQGLLRQVDDKQKAQIDSLVKIYETMKPKEAARIFEALDQPILLDVVERMKEAKTAPILAAMDPMKAREITTALAERRRLPAIPP